MKHLQFRSSVASSTSTKSCIEELKILKSSECLFFQPQQTFRTLVSVSASLRENSLTDTNDSSSNTTLFETTKKTLDQVKKNINLSKLETFKLFFKNIINNIITMISNNEVYGALILLDMMIELYQTQANTHLINSSDNNLLHTEDNTQELAANTTNNVIKNLIVNTISNSFTEIIDNIFNYYDTSNLPSAISCEQQTRNTDAQVNKLYNLLKNIYSILDNNAYQFTDSDFLELEGEFNKYQKTINKKLLNSESLSLEQKKDIKRLIDNIEGKIARIYILRNNNSEAFRKLVENPKRSILYK